MTDQPTLRVESVHPALPDFLEWLQEDPEIRLRPDQIAAFLARWESEHGSEP